MEWQRLTVRRNEQNMKDGDLNTRNAAGILQKQEYSKTCMIPKRKKKVSVNTCCSFPEEL